MTCAACRWSAQLPSLVLWCYRHLRPALCQCREFEREPGADDV